MGLRKVEMLPTRANVAKTLDQTPHPKNGLSPPQRARQAPLVTVVEAKPVRGQNPFWGHSEAKAKGRRGSVGANIQSRTVGRSTKRTTSMGPSFYGYTRAHVEAEAQAFRDQYAANGKLYVDWDAHFFARLCDGRNERR